MEKVTAQILVATPIEAGVSLVVQADNGTSGIINVRSKKYDEATKKYVDDAETLAKGLETLNKLGATSFETAPAELLGVSQDVDGNDIEVYTSNGRVSFNPIKTFMQFDSLDASAKRQLDKETNEFRVALPMTEWALRRFNLGFKVETKDGEKTYRASQLQFFDEEANKEVSIGLKTVSKQVNVLQDQIRENKIPKGFVEKVQKSIEDMSAVTRQDVLDRLSRLFGVDFEKEVLSGKKLIKAALRPQTISNEEGNSYWLVAYLDKEEGLLVDNPDYVEDEAAE